MKLFLLLVVLVGGYVFIMLQTTNIVINQTQRLSSSYQYAAAHSDQIATGFSR